MDSIICPNCGAEVATEYCGRCGQKRQSSITWKGVAAAIYDAFFDFESPFLKSVVQLTINPGKVYREYLAGARKRYFSPIRYSFWLLTLFIAASSFTGIAIIDVPPTDIPDPQDEANFVEFVAYLNTAVLPLTAVMALGMAVMTRLMFRTRGYRVVELFIPCLLSVGHFSLVSTATIFLGYYDSNDGDFGSVMIIASLAYMTWGFVGLFEARRVGAVLYCLLAATMAQIVSFVITVMGTALIAGIISGYSNASAAAGG